MNSSNIDVYSWNAWLDYVQAKLNDIKNAMLRSPIDKDKFVEPTLGRVDVGAGASKVLELDGSGGMTVKPVTAATSVNIGPTSAECINFDFSTRRINFKLNNAIKTYVNYSGWQGLTQEEL